MPVSFELLDRLAVCQAAHRSRQTAAQQVVFFDHPQGVYHRQQLYDVPQQRLEVKLLCVQLAAEVHQRVLPALIVWLHQDNRECEMARVRRKQLRSCAECRIKSA